MFKKGWTINLDALQNIVLLSFIILVFLGAIYKVKDDTIHIQEREVREFALARDAALASPHALEYEYKLPHGFELEVDDNCKVAVRKETEEKVTQPAQYFCGNSKDERLTRLKEEKKEDGNYVGVGVR